MIVDPKQISKWKTSALLQYWIVNKVNTENVQSDLNAIVQSTNFGWRELNEIITLTGSANIVQF